jgi:hypothetical protein
MYFIYEMTRIDPGKCSCILLKVFTFISVCFTADFLYELCAAVIVVDMVNTFCIREDLNFINTIFPCLFLAFELILMTEIEF